MKTKKAYGVQLMLLLSPCTGTLLGQAADAGETVAPSLAEVSLSATSADVREARLGWWRDAKFGMFIHWGVYAVPAGSYGGKSDHGEWLMHSEKIPVAEYQLYARAFNPVRYNPDAWAAVADAAGMKYVVITAKHHDGFALFPSAASRWNVVDSTAYGKDLLAPLVHAVKGRNMKMGFYYSHAQDWNNKGGAKSRFSEGKGWDAAHEGSFDTYLKEVSLPQVKELLSGYPIDILWWDTPTWMNKERTAPFASLVADHPNLITNNRLGGGEAGDTLTPEQFIPVAGYERDWETCMTMNRHWGYNSSDQDWKSAGDLIRKLAEVCAKGGNFLLNVGPKADGEFPDEAISRLREVGAWLKLNGESIYGTRAGPFSSLSWGCVTRRANRLYLHVFSWPDDGLLRVPLLGASGRAYLLTDLSKTSLPIKEAAHRLEIRIPTEPSDTHNTVIVLDVEGPIQVAPLPSQGAKVTASASADGTGPEYSIDSRGNRIWRAPSSDKTGWLEIDLGSPTAVAGFGFDEPDVWPRFRQKYILQYEGQTGWVDLEEGTTSGHGAKKYFKEINARKFRLAIECDAGGPGVAEIQFYSPE